LKSPKLYTIRKFDLKQLINNNNKLDIPNNEMKKYEIKQQDNMLFRQIRLITGDIKEYNKYIIFLNCKGYKKYESQLRQILKEGFYINNIKFLPSEKSASMSRNSIMGFVDASSKEELDKRINMDISLPKTVLAKLLAYRGLMFSSCFCIENWYPNIVVVDDYSKVLENQAIKYVVDIEKDCINKNGQPYKWREKGIEEGQKNVKINLWDGSGIHSSRITQFIKEIIGSDENPTSILWRLPYGKGMTHEINFEKWFLENGKTHITDIWGVEHNILEVDMIITASFYKGYKYFKKYGDYRDWQLYWEKFKQYNHCIGVATWNYSFDNEPAMTKSSYQILQDLDLPFEEFIKLSDYTTEWINKIIDGDLIYTYCFLGIFADHIKPSNDYVKAILKNPEMLKEETIRNYFVNLLRKNIDLMKCGKLYLNGSFKFVVTDLIMFLRCISGKEVSGELKNNEFYTKDRNGVCLEERIIERNPHISKEEHLILKGTDNELLNEYCGHLQNVAMLNGYSLSLPKLNGADEDGDRVFVIDSDIMKSGINQNLPVVIDIDDKITALEEEINEVNIIDCQIRSMVSLVGEISNYATCYHNKMAKTEDQKQKYLGYINLLSVINGKSIDYSKTGILWHVPRHIAKYSKPLPYFIKYAGEYYKNKKLLSKAQSNLNRLAFAVEKWEKKIRFKKKYKEFNYNIMIDNNIEFNQDKYNKIEQLYIEFDSEMKDLRKLSGMLKNPDEYKDYFEDMSKKQMIETEIHWGYYYELYKNKAKQICKNNKELANLVVKLCYEKYPKKSKKFIWIVAGQGIVENLKQQNIQLPIKDKNGNYEYLGKYYKLQEVTEFAQ
jgi:hypothetical protein